MNGRKNDKLITIIDSSNYRDAAAAKMLLFSVMELYWHVFPSRQFNNIDDYSMAQLLAIIDFSLPSNCSRYSQAE